MRAKADIPVNLLDQTKSTPLIKTWFEIVHLKQLFRAGWLNRGLSEAECETVAEHTFGNALLCLLLLPEQRHLDPLKVLTLALIHDLGEAYVGDITPQDNVDRATKIARETDAVQKIFGELPGGESFISLWQEYESQETAESRFVKEIDRLELALQASVYEHQGKVDSTEFREAAESAVTSSQITEILGVLKTLSESS